ncbi:glycosyl hydrolase family 28-related protein [Ostreiculturibacter nitratireducens]|uniref:glycosyl hydrolase family 28-related protein n=1 Tax=Ostreiculturibacter nitratireducens TaxID=3075226 RepID=UPI0031B57212
MNKAITDGLMLMPPAFAEGLDVWSSGDGTPGSATYAGAANAALVPADQDFGGCLEMMKTQSVQKLRYMGETSILPGCYLRVSAKVKAMSGNLPSVRIAGWAGGAGGQHVSGLLEVGPSVALTSYGEVVTVTAIVGTGARGGVDMVWTSDVLYGHFGLDLMGADGGTVRIEDIVIEDVTSAYLRDLMDWVDVRDYGAKGDGVTDDSAAFEAADAAAVASSRSVLVSKGVYFLGNNVSMEAETRFEGTVTMPVDKRLSLTRNFDLPTYAAAFGDEVQGFKKAFQSLLNYSDHDALDLKGRRIELSEPIDMQAAVANKDVFQIRRVIRDGAFHVIDGPAWTPDVVTSQASYNTSNQTTLTGVVNVANVPVGSLVQGNGVGREIYVKERNVSAGTLTLSQPLYGGSGTQVFTFTRFKYVLDFSGFQELDRFNLDDVEIQCNGYASGIMLARQGDMFQLRDCYIIKPRDRGVTSIGRGCQDLHIDRCQFISSEMGLRAQDRSSIAFNINANDAKIRDNRFMRFGTTGIVNGNGHVFVGNHWFQGDEEVDGLRVAGLVLTETNVKTTITGNYIDNNFIEWTNEYEADPALGSQYSFGGLTLTGNIFTASDVAPWFSWIVVKPYGQGHFIHGLYVTGNVFKSLQGSIDRVEKVDTSVAGLDFSRMKNIHFEGNSFNGVSQSTESPVYLEHVQETAATTWTIGAGPYLPFGGWARNVESIVAEGMITGPSNERRSDMPYVTVEQGAAKQDVKLNWANSSKGKVKVRVRVDNPN